MRPRDKTARRSARQRESFWGSPVFFLFAFAVLGWCQLNGLQVVLDFSKPSPLLQSMDAVFLACLIGFAWRALAAGSLASSWRAFSFFILIFAAYCALTGALGLAFAVMVLGVGMGAWRSGWFTAASGGKSS